MPPRKGESSTSTVRSPARAAVMAAAVPAEPPPTTTRSASSATGRRSSGAISVPRAMSRRGRGLARLACSALPQAVGDLGDPLEQHVEARDVGPGRGRERLAIRRERAVDLLLLPRHDRVVLAEAGVHPVGQALEPLLAVLAQARADHLAPQLREGEGGGHLAAEPSGQE